MFSAIVSSQYSPWLRLTKGAAGTPWFLAHTGGMGRAGWLRKPRASGYDNAGVMSFGRAP